VRVLLIDDHALFREGIVGLLETRGIEIDATGDSSEGIALVKSSKPDVILLDLRMPEMSGIEVLQKLNDLENKIPVVMLTTSADDRDLSEALRNGVKGYLLKDMEPDEVKDGDSADSRVAASPFSSLTPREMEILCHLAEGQSNKVIARNLNISDGTVKLHVKAILRKLEVHSRVEAAVMAVERRLCNRKMMSD
jgi:two-component system nitrate/nitrite response regulator NarL